MYSNNILNSQESTTILDACTKKSGNLLKAPRTSRSFDPGQKTRICVNKQEGKNLSFSDLALPTDHRVNLKENEKLDKYLDFAWELKNYGT